ncbi:4Fe-4S dicluster domain-containing protein [Chloroflexota bacterium]
MRHIVLDAESCAGCSVCEIICALSHDGVVSPHFSRLRITDYYVEGHRIEGYVCKQCTSAECLRVCRTKATKALYVDKETGAKVIDTEKCNGCQLCMLSCPQYPNAPIFYNAEKGVCFKCDLCSGDPLCVKFCPENALSFPQEMI